MCAIAGSAGAMGGPLVALISEQCFGYQTQHRPLHEVPEDASRTRKTERDRERLHHVSRRDPKRPRVGMAKWPGGSLPIPAAKQKREGERKKERGREKERERERERKREGERENTKSKVAHRVEKGESDIDARTAIGQMAPAKRSLVHIWGRRQTCVCVCVFFQNFVAGLRETPEFQRACN